MKEFLSGLFGAVVGATVMWLVCNDDDEVVVVDVD